MSEIKNEKEHLSAPLTPPLSTTFPTLSLLFAHPQLHLQHAEEGIQRHALPVVCEDETDQREQPFARRLRDGAGKVGDKDAGEPTPRRLRVAEEGPPKRIDVGLQPGVVLHFVGIHELTQDINLLGEKKGERVCI